MLSKRLKQIAQMIDKNKVVYDVGSDHGLLPCFLALNNISNLIYASDINEKPLNKAKENIKKYHLEDKVIPVLCDGINPEIEADVVVIAGMGYFTIEHILNNTDIDKYQYFIVESNSDVELLRRYISDHNYSILDEKVVKDNFYYEIIKFSNLYHDKYNDLEIKYGPILLEKREKIFLDYLDYKKMILKRINMNANKVEYENSIKEIEEILYN